MKLTAWWNDQEKLVRLGLTLIKIRPILLVPAAIVTGAAGLPMFAVAMLIAAIGPLILKRRYDVLHKRVRPRFGRVVNGDGDELPIVFYPHPDDPETFCAYHAGDESPVDLRYGCRVIVDSMRDGQSIAFGVPREDVS